MPATLSSSRVRALETGAAKLWVLLIGVNHYEDDRFPALAYSALDCQGLGEAIAAATQAFPQRTVIAHHDFAGDHFDGHELSNRSDQRLVDQVAIAGRMRLTTVAKFRNFPAKAPRLEQVRSSLRQICAEAKPQDTVLFYFSGHGILEAEQAVLCLSGTRKDDVLNTGLPIQELLRELSQCAAHQQLVWLDACHSGGMTIRGAKSESAAPIPNPTPQLVDLLRQRAAQSKGFYALLSCDQNQQSWEFPELGHGVFTYFLMRGLLGEAADSEGVIEVDTLYKYVYYQTLRYIDKTNQQLRLINQQQRGRGDAMQPEYPQQTPKRIVEGVGELILGIKPDVAEPCYPRQALVVEGLAASQTTLELSKVLRQAGGFELNYFPQAGKEWAGLREVMQSCLQSSQDGNYGDATTVLLYLRGRVEQTESGDARLILKDEVEISRSWLRQVLRKSAIARQIIILDCPGAELLAEWIEDLQVPTGRGQCLIAAASPIDDPDWFGRVLLETLRATDPQVGLSIAGWIAQIQAQLVAAGITPHLWLSGTHGVIEVLPGGAKGGESAFDLGVCPYLGLRAFSEDDAPFFFGREGLTQELVNRLNQRSFLAVVGASGSGKSSVVQAGVMAQLRQGKQIPGSEHWWIRSVRPGAHPLESLVQRLVDSGSEKERQYQKLQIEGMLYQGVEGFVYWLRSRPEPMIVLVVDQFEELLTLAADEERQRFLSLVMGGLEHAGDRFKLVITLRTDFIAPCLEYADLAQALQQSSVMVSPALEDESYRQAIVRPAEKVGLKVEPELVEVLLQELNHLAGDLPLLEFVLEQLWEQRQPGLLTLQVYQQQIGGLKGALEQKAQAVYEGLDGEAQACARWIFLALTQLGEGTEDTRRRVLKSDLVVKKYPQPLIERTLQALTAGKLVIVNVEDAIAEDLDLLKLKQQVTIEVVHEILIRHWSTLRWWLEENRGRVRSQRQIEQSAAQWQQSQQQSDFLLRGVRLDAAEEIYVKYTDELSQDVQLFIEAGLRQRQQEKEQVQQRLKQAKRAIALIGSLGLAAAGFGGFALWQRQQAMVNEITALNALSESQLLAHQQLEAITTSLKASRQIQSLWFGKDRVQIQTVATLQQAIAETQESNRLEGHRLQVNRGVTRPDGKMIATASDDRTVKLWQPDGTLMQSVELSDRVTDLAFTQDGTLLAVSTADGKVALLNGNNGAITRSIAVGNMINSIAISPNDQFLATASRTVEDGVGAAAPVENRTIKIWNLATGQLLKTLTGHNGWVNEVQFSPDGQILASASEDKTIKLWNVGTGSLIRNLAGHQERVTSVAFTPDGKMLVSGSGDRTLKLWSLNNGTAQAVAGQTLEGHTDQINDVQVSPNGQWIVSASQDDTLKIWQRDGLFLQTIQGHGAAVLSTMFNTDRALLSTSADKTVRLWDLPPWQKTADLYTSVAVQGEQIATAQNNRIQLGSKTLTGHQLPISALQFSLDGKRLASGSDDKTVKLWDVNGTLLQSFTGHQAKINDLAFSPDGKLLASSSDDQTLRLWKTDGQMMAEMKGHQDAVSRVLFSPDGQMLASASYDQTVKLWRIDGTLVRTLEMTGAIAAIAFSPDGQTLAVGSWDNTIQLWRIDGTLIKTLTGHLEGVTNLSFNLEGTVLASVSEDKTIKLWNTNGDLIKTMWGETDRVLAIGFSQDHQTLLRAGETTGVTRLNLSLSGLMEKGCDRLGNYLKHHPNLGSNLCP